MQAESAGDVHAVSPKGAMGLMQIMPATWEELRARYGLGDDPFKPRDNILAGAAYLREMLDHFGKKGFLAAYNAGPARYKEYLAKGRPLPRETADYLKKLAPVIDGLAPVPPRSRRSDDRHDPRRSQIIAPSRSIPDVEPVHADLNSNAARDTVFTATAAPGKASTTSDFVSDLTAIAPPANHGWDNASTTIRPSGSELFVRRSSASTP